MRNRDASADPGRAQILAPLQHLEQHPFRLIVELEEGNELLQDVVLRRALELQLDGVLGKKLAQLHSFPLFGVASARLRGIGQVTDHR